MSAPAWTDGGLFWISVVAFATSAVSIVLSIVQFKLTGGVVEVSIAITSVGMMAATGRCRA
jgi:hypothetical protein